MLEQLKDLHTQALEELDKVENPRELELWRIRHLGKKSSLTKFLRSLSALPLEERQKEGAQANEIKKSLESSLEGKRKLLQEPLFTSPMGTQRLDVTLPGRPIPIGRLHPTTQILNEICDIFKNMGN